MSRIKEYAAKVKVYEEGETENKIEPGPEPGPEEANEKVYVTEDEVQMLL